MDTNTPDQARMWLLCFSEAEHRKGDSSLPMAVRMRSAETCALLLQAAANAGQSYESLKVLSLAH